MKNLNINRVEQKKLSDCFEQFLLRMGVISFITDDDDDFEFD